VGASLVSSIIALAASMILRRVAAARRLRPSVRTMSLTSAGTALPRGITAASLIFTFPIV
jgi:hypothetical protein